jgi:hypothetical protein
VILPYCVLPADSAAELPARGIADARIHTLAHGAIAAAYSEFEKPRRRQPEAMEYAQAITRVFARVLVLPFRFGTSFAGQEELRAHLAETGPLYERFLVEHLNHVQMEVRLPAAGAPGEFPNPASGREFMQQKLTVRQRDKNAFLNILEASGPLVLKALEIESPGFGITGRKAVLLVDRSSVAELREQWQLAFGPGDSARVSGPVPPTDFFNDMVKRSRQA